MLSSAAALASGSYAFEFKLQLNTPKGYFESPSIVKKDSGGGNSSGSQNLVGGGVTTQSLTGLVTTPQTYSGTLNGKIVFTSGGHGWQWNDTLNRYATDRGDNNEIVEDFGNQEQMSFYADYILRAGGTVVPMRPVGRQINEVVLDNDSAGVVFTGTWSNSSSTRYYDEDYGTDAIPYKFASTVTGAATSTVTYTPNIPQAGFYPVYGWVLRGTDRAIQTYRVNHTGGASEVSVDHSKVGSGWIYLGTYHFDAGSNTDGSVVITNKAPTAGDVVIADAIRFGNGMGDWVDTPTGAPGISGYPREDENSFHWIARSVGTGTTLTTATGASTNNNVSAPSNFAQYMFAGTFGEAVYIGFHSNAGGGRGARGLIDSSAPTPNQAGTNGLADILGDQINQDMQNQNGVYEFNWTTGTTSTFTSGFGEINLGASAEMDATIIEVAFHDDASDAAIMRDPKGRDAIARATYQGTLQYFSLYGSPLATNTTAPQVPTTVRAISNTSGQVTLNWANGTGSPASVYGAATTGYMVYTSEDGYGFDGGRAVAGVGTTTLTITGLDATAPYYFKVAATNAGGESAATEVVAALPSGGAKQVLIVNGFERYDRTQNFRYAYAHVADGLVDRVWPRYNNSFDYINRVERALQAAKPGTHVASTSNDAVIAGTVNLTDYPVVVWILGNESTTNDTFNATEQTKVTQFLAAGGNLFVSGAEIAWDLDQQNNGRTFFENTLKGNYVADDAAVYTATVVGSPGIFATLSNFAFSSGASSTVYSTRDDQVYDVTTPDVISPQAGAASALTYGAGSAGIQVGTGGIDTGSIVMFGFPIETMTNETRRTQAMTRILDFLGAGYTIETRVNGQDADSVTGPIVANGGSVTLTYVVANTGIIALTSIALSDDNGTPGTPGDDFVPILSSGDTNSNNIFDVGETWTYTAVRTATAGQRTHSGKATVVTGAQTLVQTDVGNYFGSAPGISVQTSIDGQDADSPPGPTINQGSSGTFTYVVTNTGNIALGTIVVKDDNATPGTPGDDITPSFTSGDTNSNNLLDLSETWTYTSVRTLSTPGSFVNSGSASGQDSIAQSVNSAEAVNYVVQAVASGTISGQVYRDDNGNGAFDLGEPTLNGVTITLSGAGSGSVMTSGSGNYSFGSLGDGSYTVTQTVPANYIATTSTSIPLVISGGNTFSNQHFGDFLTVYTGTGGDDVYLVSRSGLNTLISENATNFQIATASLTTLTFSPGSGDDVIEIDYTNGSPIPSGGITIDGGGQSTASGDLIIVTGSANGDTFAIDNTQIIGSTINYLGTERVEFNLAGGNDTLNFNGPVTAAVTFNGDFGDDTLNINSGTFNFDTNAAITTASLTVNVNPDDTGTANAIFNSAQNLAALNIGDGGQATIAAGPNKTLLTKAIAIDPLGRLDLNDGALVLDYAATDSTPVAAIKAYVLAGRNGTDFASGDWNGTGGIMSSVAAGQDLVSFAIGYADNSFLPQLGLPSYTDFKGQTVDGDAILVRYTLGADANLDGKVNTDDVTVVGALFNSAGSGEWYFGDFDYDGIVDSDDVTVLGAMYDPTAPPL